MAKLYFVDADQARAVRIDRASVSLGRARECDVVVAEPCVSRLHATIVREDDGFLVVDQNSTHGTWVNAVRVRRERLKDNDVIQLGSEHGQRLSFRVGDEVAVAPELPDLAGTTLMSTLEGLRESTASGPAAGRLGEIERLNWLLRAARQINEGGAVDEILAALLRVTLQLTGVERGFVFLAQGGASGRTMRLAVGLDKDGLELLEDSTVSRNAMQRAIDAGTRFSITDTMADSAAAVWESVIANRIRSVYCIPLRARGGREKGGELLGLLYLDSRVVFGRMSEVDHQLLDTLATEAAALLHNALLAEDEQRSRKAREELAVAAAIHSGLMSMTLPTLPFARLEAKSAPCLAIGGDFYDVVALPGCVCATIADVSGKGVSAAIVAATLQGIIHAQMLARQPLAEIASLVNQFLCERKVGKYATLVMAKLWADGRLEMLNCGHVPPVLISETEGAAREIGEGNLIVGLIAEATYAAEEFRMRPGERLLLVTDGITEAEDAGGAAFGYEGLARAAHGGCVEGILRAVAEFHAPAESQDDCTLLEVVYTG